MRTIEINGVNFELKKPRTKVTAISGYRGCPSDIFRWYGRPSSYKVAIWNDWCKWQAELEHVYAFNICGANGFAFSISGNIIYNGKEYNLYITKAHNIAIEVTED